MATKDELYKELELKLRIEEEGLNVLPKDNDIIRYGMAAFGALQMVMMIAVPCYLISKPGYVAQYEQQEKLIKELEYNRILNNKQNKT